VHSYRKPSCCSPDRRLAGATITDSQDHTRALSYRRSATDDPGPRLEEVAGFRQGTLPLVASSALAALSLAVQARVDVKRADKLQGPVGLFLLTIADSGERKSTCDGFFTSAIRKYQQDQAEAMKPIVDRHRAAFRCLERRA